MNWHLQDAKNNFSKVVDKAIHEGPQTVTRRGKRAAVVISAEEYERLTAGKKPTLVDHILSGPEWPEDMDEEVRRRTKEPSRPPVKF
ncbi:MAG: type II toxin-antitoxin system Phd/YefM family antitoxin [Rhizobiaceae bacterium]|nr:type II toxin-antitoxin system Phd/YefM family antitoxin [Rhizobiaceae bacterium]MCV0407346.1 type II toxin-antitoxin system Phd/YefM family antitoxin [Rhizobiaceae bacterium]